MIFYTSEESEKWLSGRALEKPDMASLKNFIAYPKEASRYYNVADTIAHRFFHGDEVLLVLTEWSVWRSSENLHLYYRLRQSYHDNRLFYDAPGHLFLKHEKDDLASFLQLSMMNGWGGYIVSQACDFGLVFSHDNWFALYGNNEEEISEFHKILEHGGA